MNRLALHRCSTALVLPVAAGLLAFLPVARAGYSFTKVIDSNDPVLQAFAGGSSSNFSFDNFSTDGTVVGFDISGAIFSNPNTYISAVGSAGNGHAASVLYQVGKTVPPDGAEPSTSTVFAGASSSAVVFSVQDTRNNFFNSLLSSDSSANLSLVADDHTRDADGDGVGGSGPAAIDGGAVYLVGNGHALYSATPGGAALTLLIPNTVAAPSGVAFTAFQHLQARGGTLAILGQLANGTDGLYTARETGGPLSLLADTTQPCPAGGGTFQAFGASQFAIAIDSVGEFVAFISQGSYQTSGIFTGLALGSTSLTTAVKFGDAAPEGGTFNQFTGVYLDGQTVFFTAYTTKGGGRSLYAVGGSGEGGITRLMGSGDQLDGGVIDDVYGPAGNGSTGAPFVVNFHLQGGVDALYLVGSGGGGKTAELTGTFPAVKDKDNAKGVAKVSGTLNITNSGSKGAKNVVANVYLSDDSTFDAADQSIGQITLAAANGTGTLGKNKSYALPVKVKVPGKSASEIAGRFLIFQLQTASPVADSNQGIVAAGPLP